MAQTDENADQKLVLRFQNHCASIVTSHAVITLPDTLSD